MNLLNFLILLSPSVVILAALFFVAFLRYISYRERVALVERGVDIEAVYRHQQQGRQGNRGILWAGMITAASGLGLLAGLWMLGNGVWLIAGFVPLSVGLGMLLIYYLTLGSPAAHHDAPASELPPEPAPVPTDDPAAH